MNADDTADLCNELNLYLRFCGVFRPVSCKRHRNVRTVTRATGDVLWLESGMCLCEITTDSFANRDRILCYLRDNATSQCSRYVLFATSADVAFTVSVATWLYLREIESMSTTSDTRDESDGSMDLYRAFAYGTWCCCDLDGGNFLSLISTEERVRNHLPENPLRPLLIYDIEIVAKDENVLPRGVEDDQRLSSVAVTVNDTAAVVLVYVPIHDPGVLERYESEFRRRFAPMYVTVMFFSSEESLLFNAVRLLCENEPLVDLYGLESVRDARELACVVSGYNHWNYDYDFLLTRLVFHGMYDLAATLARFSSEPRFNFHQISFDMMKHVIARRSVRSRCRTCARSSVPRVERSEISRTNSGIAR